MKAHRNQQHPIASVSKVEKDICILKMPVVLERSQMSMFEIEMPALEMQTFSASALSTLALQTAVTDKTWWSVKSNATQVTAILRVAGRGRTRLLSECAWS